MANLEKVIKVTQAQYDVLASGGTIGSYTGLDDNYIYLIEDTNTYITSDGGTIDGNLEIDGRLELHNNVDEPLDIYYDNEDCYSLVLHPNTQDYDNKYRIDVEEIENHEEGEEPVIYDLSLPARSGILAIREEIPEVNNGTLSIQGNGTTASTFGANQSGNTTLNIKGSGGTTVTKSANNEITISTGSINNATLTIQQNSTTVSTFTANASSNVTANIITPQVLRYI